MHCSFFKWRQEELAWLLAPLAQLKRLLVCQNSAIRRSIWSTHPAWRTQISRPSAQFLTGYFKGTSPRFLFSLGVVVPYLFTINHSSFSVKKKRNLAGILYFHDICKPRWAGEHSRMLSNFKILCGKESEKLFFAITTCEFEMDEESVEQQKNQLMPLLTAIETSIRCFRNDDQSAFDILSMMNNRQT